MKVLAWVKEHPKTAGGILLGLVVLLVFSLRSGSANTGTSAVVTVQPTNTAQNTALMEAQLNAQVATSAMLSQAGVQTAAIDAAKTVQLAQTNNATQVALSNIAATADTTKYVSNLGAQVANNQTEAAKAINDAQMSAATQIATINANANTTVATLASQMTANNNATNITLAGITSDTVKYQTDASKAVQLSQIDASKTVQLSQQAYNFNLDNNILNSINWVNIHYIDNASAMNSYALALGQPANYNAQLVSYAGVLK